MRLADYVIAKAQEWYNGGNPVVLATIAGVWGSSSQPLGSRMAITSDDQFVGSVSGGCVESDVNRRARQVMESGTPRRLNYRKVEDPELDIGLNCEGQIDVILEPYTDALQASLATPPPRLIITSYRDVPGTEGTLETIRLDLNRYAEGLPLTDSLDQTRSGEQFSEILKQALARIAGDRGIPFPLDPIATETLEAVASGTSRAIPGPDGWRHFIEVTPRPPTLLIVSAGSVAFPLSQLGKDLGYHVVVSDPRSSYIRQELFPAADQLLCVWPNELPRHVRLSQDTMVVSLNHEPRFEDDLFRTLMKQPPVGYIGAMGKRKRHYERLERQKSAGYDLERLPNVHTPVGLDLGGKDPEQIALSILAQIQAVRNGRNGTPLA